MMTSSIRVKLLPTLLPLILWIGVWQGVAVVIGQELLVPAPLAVFQQLLTLVVTPLFWQTTGYTLARVLLGLFIAVILGGLLALMTWRFTLLDWLCSPIIRIMRATPVVSFILLILLWTRRDFVPVIASGLMVLPVVWGNVVQGLRETDPKLIELAQSLRFSPLKRGLLVYIPSAMPYFLSAVITSMGLSWKAGVAAEVICLPQFSIGRQMSDSRIYLETPTLFAWTIVVVTLSLVLERILASLLSRYARRWK